MAQWSDSRYRLYRDPEHGYLAGVCAGIAQYFGIEPILVRLGFVVGLLFFFFPAVIGYIVLAIALKPRPPSLYASEAEESFWRGVATAPDDTLHKIRSRFADLERRLRAMEGQVTSKDFDLHRKFREL